MPSLMPLTESLPEWAWTLGAMIVLQLLIAVLSVASRYTARTRTKVDDEILASLLAALHGIVTTLGHAAQRTLVPVQMPKRPAASSPSAIQDLGATLALLATVGAAALALQGCGSPVQSALSASATVLREASTDASRYYLEREQLCLSDHPPETATRTDFEACMLPVRILRASRASLGRLLREAQRQWDSRGEAGLRAIAPELLRAAQDWLEALEPLSSSTGNPPRELLELIAFLEQHVNR